MELAAARMGNPQAAREIADVCTELARRRWGSQHGQERGEGFRPARPVSLEAPRRPRSRP
jgi:UDP-N-acetylglucosamine--N-acetylmuramyl-(pentapeptide) pyrophosphoryl-undecaprenol N-acetylglucosamine transferase